MPQEPKKRHSRARKGKRRASIWLKNPKGIFCPNCKAPLLPHIVCKKCGYYQGKQIIQITKIEVRKSSAIQEKTS